MTPEFMPGRTSCLRILCSAPVRRVRRSMVAGVVAGLSMAGVTAPLLAQVEPLFSLAVQPTLAHFPEAPLGTIPMVGARGEWRFGGDFSVFGEVRQGWAGSWTPPDCIVGLCQDYLGGSRSVRSWHVGLETRLAYYQAGSTRRLTAFAALGQVRVAEPRPPGAEDRVVNVDPSLLVGLANRWLVGRHLGLRLSAALSAWHDPDDVSGLSGVREVPMLSGAVTWEFGGGR